MDSPSPVRLTQYARGGGCACKIPPGELEEAVARLIPDHAVPDLIIGVENGDDAAVVRISADRAVVVVEHDLDMLTSISGHMWAMVEGRLAYSGDVESFRASAVYAGLRGIEQG